MQFLDPALVAQIKLVEKHGLIDVSRLIPETTIKVKTKNSTYILKPGQDKIAVQGGKFFPEEKKVYFCGSTFGGSTIWLHRIGKHMQMEFMTEDEKGLPLRVLTSPVLEAEVIGKDWSFKMDW